MKAILVIDVPDTKNLVVSYRVFDRAEKNHEVMKGAKSLRPMPEKKLLKSEWVKDTESWFYGTEFGWNECIEEILGETE